MREILLPWFRIRILPGDRLPYLQGSSKLKPPIDRPSREALAAEDIVHGGSPLLDQTKTPRKFFSEFPPVPMHTY
jgi:hypothetical protein